ncbi:peptidylprolyl isomerase [Pseudomaricurvus sp. HS19]|uniref:FKBP-type peptidyl-prolyl cis-trans isomerase n=1 Tax=Pseudomaricurvus sp. HS19 TaxID=2692626 RepID=UPI001371E87B|nr:peptidylprolyl isomerase [Pseudomaricurvus sp. HS19]MYM64587.1 peptidylprolyl isomerase [Pseudomaricurvus sp. HS19]
MTDLTVGEGTQVTLNFALKLENGDVIDSNLGQEPATFVVGDGNLLPGFEKALQGLKAGTNDTFVIKPEDGFGQRNDNNIQEMPRNQFSDELELVEGLMLSFADAQNAELPGLVVAFDDKTVTVDFNHPLAGRNILFEVAIVDVQPAVTH